MTKEEAIEELNAHLIHWKRLLREKICSQEDGKKTINALDMAIKALEQLETVRNTIKQHDEDRMPEDFWYLDRIREEVEE